ncbi:MAG: 5-(carboxyamino)imidazole ribonucleotide synthase [Planctomycetota bacterium]
MTSIESTSPNRVLPGGTIGILGSGQLGRMMSAAAKQMGYRVHIYSANEDSPAGQVSDIECVGSLTDLDSIKNFAQRVDVITIETENVPIDSFNTAAEFAPAYPGIPALQTCQNRGLEKKFLVKHEIPTCDFRIVRSLEDLRTACQQIMPGILKTTTGGYDGKGQARIQTKADIDQAWEDLKTNEAILEQIIHFECEFSVVGYRRDDGAANTYPPIVNDHADGILDISTSPGHLPEPVAKSAMQMVLKMMEKFGSVGVLTVEFFYADGKALVNEIAPRPHNSGHLTIEGHVTSQFEQHIRAVCGLPLGSIHQHRPVAMVNLLGDLWDNGAPDWSSILDIPETKLHLYGKETAKPKRKMGHITSTADTVDQARQNAVDARKSP